MPSTRQHQVFEGVKNHIMHVVTLLPHSTARDNQSHSHMYITPASLTVWRSVWYAFLRPDTQTLAHINALVLPGESVPPVIVYGQLDKDIVLLAGNEIYRIAEVVKGHTMLQNVIRTTSKYKRTILRRWLKRALNDTNKYAILYEEIQRYMVEHGLTPLCGLVVHIRSGDNFAAWGLGNENIRKALQKSITNVVRSGKVRYITIVTALHYGVQQNSIRYPHTACRKYVYTQQNHHANLEALRTFAQAQPVPVLFRSSKTIDQDFAYLCTAEHLITTGGYFSELIKRMNALHHEKKTQILVRV